MNILKPLFFFSGRLTRLPFFLLFALSKVILISSLIGGEDGLLHPYFDYIFRISIWVDISLVSSRLKDIGRSRLWVIAGVFGPPLFLYCFFASSAKRGDAQLNFGPVKAEVDPTQKNIIFSNSDDRFRRE